VLPMAEEKQKSLLYKLEPLLKFWPAVTKPEGHVHFRTKLTWSLLALVAYFILSNVFIYGLAPGNIDAFANFRAILAGANGSLVHLGIGPIVTGSIIMQLFAGAKIINLDLQNSEDKSIYQGVQKLLVLVMIFVESVPQVFGFLQPDPALAAKFGGGLVADNAGMIFGAILLAGSMFLLGIFAGGLSPSFKSPVGKIILTVVVFLMSWLLYWTMGSPLGAGIGLAIFLLAFFLSSREESAEHGVNPWVVGAPVILAAIAGFALGFVLHGTPVTPLGMARAVIVVQLAIGSYLVFLMDEVVSKWGLGSGISLFIVAGVSQALFTGLLNWMPAQGAFGDLGVNNPPAGVIPKTFYLIWNVPTAQLVHGGTFETIFLQQPNPMIALIATIITFVVVVYAESARVELPLAHGRVRGARGRYPIRLLYASNIPVILAGALLANINLFGLLLFSGPMRNVPLIGYEWLNAHFPEHSGIIGTYGFYGQANTQATSGIAYYFSQIGGVQDWLLPFLGDNYAVPGREKWQLLLHVLLYAIFMIGGSILFAIFWIETTNMGPDQVAKQIQRSGMQIPGFRRDPRVTSKILERYIPVVTVIGGAAVGGLAVFADLLGTVGNASGTGILLAVGILQRLYEQIAKEQAMEMHPVMRSFFGEG